MILPSNLIYRNGIDKLWTFEVEASKWPKRQYHTLAITYNLNYGSHPANRFVCAFSLLFTFRVLNRQPTKRAVGSLHLCLVWDTQKPNRILCWGKKVQHRQPNRTEWRNRDLPLIRCFPTTVVPQQTGPTDNRTPRITAPEFSGAAPR